MMRIPYLFCVSIVFLFSACDLKNKPAEDEKDGRTALMEADRGFSKMSVEKGMKNAFLHYIDSNGVLLRPGVLPIAGADAVDYLISLNDSGFTYEWRPKQAVVAASDDLGYTYGTYMLTPGTKDTVLYGTYVTIWKKGAGGEWKFVLDAGNEGVGTPEEENP